MPPVPVEGGSSEPSWGPSSNEQRVATGQAEPPAAALSRVSQGSAVNAKRSSNIKEMVIGTFNIKGSGVRYSKYRDVSAWMRVNKIAVLALQETKINNLDVPEIEKANPRINLYSSNLPGRSAGVGFLVSTSLAAKWTIGH